MTQRVPEWLSHLRTDRRGLPVPYINLWGTEDITRLSLAHDEHAHGVAVFLDDSKETVPDFTRQHMGRQRECMAAGLCQVCARPVPWSRRFLVLADLAIQHIDLNGRVVPTVTEPWLCERCAHFALRTCPALIRRTRAENLHLFEVTSQRQIQLIASRGWIDGPLEAESRRLQPVMWLKLALIGQLEAVTL